jgi:glutamine synthetase
MTDSLIPAAERAAATAFLEDHPEIEVLEAMIPDVNAVLRGKWLPRSGFGKVFRDGLSLPCSALALDVWGQDVSASGLVFETGDADGICLPVADSLKLVPWLERPTAQVLLTMRERDGSPFFGDPRQVLFRVLERFRALRLTPVVALELEFYLIDRRRDAAGRPQPPPSPATGRRLAQNQLYSIDELEDFNALLGDIAHACAIQDIPVEASVTENAPGQLEINLHHVADAVAAADHAVLMKRAIKGVARRHRLEATFMAKPYGGESGSGMHAHISLLDQQGSNVFDAWRPDGGRRLRQAVAGMLETLNDAMGIFAPHANSYRRFQSRSHAPLTPSWGFDNRTAALRIPADQGPAARIEHRVAGADANPYLVLAALLGGVHRGIIEQLEPPAPITGDAYQAGIPGLPESWIVALRLFAKSAFIDAYLGDRYRRLFAACKRQELEVLAGQITDREYEAYLRVI